MKRNAAWPLGVAHEGRFVPCAGNNGGVAQDHPGSAGHETAGAWHASAKSKNEARRTMLMAMARSSKCANVMQGAASSISALPSRASSSVRHFAAAEYPSSYA